jgi:hypothetical protein
LKGRWGWVWFAFGAALLGGLASCTGSIPAAAPTAAIPPTLSSTAAVRAAGIYIDVAQILQSPPALSRDEANPLYEKFGNLPVLASSDDPRLVVAAASRVDGALTVVVDNRGMQNQTTPVRIHPTTTTCRPMERWILDDNKQPEIADRLDFNDGDGVEFLAHSLTLLVLPAP